MGSTEACVRGRPWTARAQVSLLVLTAAALAGGAVVGARRPPIGVPTDETVLLLTTSATFVGVGILVSRWRGANRVAGLLVVTGAVHWLGFLSNANHAVVYTIGGILHDRYLAPLAHLLLALPTGRLDRPAARIAAGLVYTALVSSLIGPLFDECDPVPGFGCPGNLLLIADRPDIEAFFRTVTDVITVAAFASVIAALVHRWVRGSMALRRVVGPPYLAGIALLATWLAPLLTESAANDANLLLRQLATVGVPFAVLIGLFRGRLPYGGQGDLARLAATGDLAGDLDAAVKRALGDPSARLVVGDSAELPSVGGNGRVTPEGAAPPKATAATLVLREGNGMVSLVHDAALLAEPEILEAVIATTAIALRNQWLATEVERQLSDVRASRARVVAAADDERRRIERNLHDGAQQRLLALSMTLHAARAARDGQRVPLLDEAVSEVTAILADLRELARGLHPAVLEERGLVAAVEALAERASVAVEVHVHAVGALPADMAAAAYYVVAESLTNVARHACATHATVELHGSHEELAVIVTDDGRGGAATRKGGGIEGLLDRVAALGGVLEVSSSPEDGTRVAAVFKTVERR